VRNGYRPNAILRPVLCAGAGGKENVKEKETTTTKANPSGKGKERNIGPEADNSGIMLSIGVLTSERARGSCSPGSGIREHGAQFTCAAQTPGMFP